ncbi:MAG: C69 family dipeptidase [Candidatus Aminicenantales bacterium]
MKGLKFAVISGLILLFFAGLGAFKPAGFQTAEVPRVYNRDACTDIIVGKKASTDGSVMTSHTGCCPECRVHVVPAGTFEKGARAPVYYGLQDVKKPLHEYGKVIGTIPQVEKTYKYFHRGYPHINEHQLAIGESTLSQRDELKVDIDSGKQIMTIEQATLFALQRCKTAREAIGLITSLLEEYGFLPSCGPESEALCIADTQEAWVLEVFSVGKDWEPGRGEIGAIWAAQRVPDDHVTIVPNWSIIKEIDLSDPENFMASKNYMEVAIWAIDFVDNLLYLQWQEAIKDLQAVRDPLEAELFKNLKEVDARALDLFRRDPELAKEYLTDVTKSNMEKVVKMYKDLRNLLITKYTNNKLGL